MTQKSVYDVFLLSKAVSSGFPHLLPIHPLQHVLAPDETPDPLLIIRFDFRPKSRISMPGVPRIDGLCTHATLTVLRGPGQPPISVAFGAACAVYTFDGQGFVPLNPGHEEGGNRFDTISRLPLAQQIGHPVLYECFDGYLNDESWRHADNSMSTKLTPLQLNNVLAEIANWQALPPPYQVMATEGKNCQSFVIAVARAGGINLPLWLKLKPWLPLSARYIDKRTIVRGGLVKEGDWWLQSRAVTQRKHYSLAGREIVSSSSSRSVQGVGRRRLLASTVQ